MNFKVEEFDVKMFDEILSKGLSRGLGKIGQQVCIEAAICQVLHLPHGDDPGCVIPSERIFKITLNDANWSSPEARAKGLRDLGLAQLGSLGVVSDADFLRLLIEKTIRVLIPTLFREVFPNDKKCLVAANRCEQEGTKDAAYAAANAVAAYAAYAYAAANAVAAYAAYAYAAYAYAYAAAYAAYAYAANAAASDRYLVLSAQLALETLRELKSPGVVLL